MAQRGGRGPYRGGGNPRPQGGPGPRYQQQGNENGAQRYPAPSGNGAWGARGGGNGAEGGGRGGGRGRANEGGLRGGGGERGYQGGAEGGRGYQGGGRGAEGGRGYQGGARGAEGGRGYDGANRGAEGGRGYEGASRGAEGGAASLEHQMGRMSVGGRGRGRGERAPLTAEQKRERTMKSYDLVPTRGEVASKQGTSGDQIKLYANYFSFTTKPDFTVFKYRVDFNDSGLNDQTLARKRLLRQHVDRLPRHVFDGSMIFSTQRLFPVTTDTLVLSSENKKNMEEDKVDIVEITIKAVGEVSSTDHDYIHFFNIVWRSALEKMNLKMINRNYYDPAAAIAVPQFNLEIWPGYVTTIRQQENSLLLNAEVSNKILRTDSAMAQIRLILGRRGTQEDVKRALIGAVVITKYNNKTYRIDDVNFDINPMSTFEKKTGEFITFKEYFLTRYNIQIRDLTQPILLSMPKDKDRRGGTQVPVSLIPEIAMMTGLTDEQRSNWKLTSHIAEWTRMEPPRRIQTLLTFANRVTQTPEVSEVLEKFNMRMNPTLTEVRGRVLNAEAVTLRNKKTPYQNVAADWTQVVQGGLYEGVEISNWVMIYPGNQEQALAAFYDFMCADSVQLGVTLQQPEWIPLRDTRTATYIQAINECLMKNFIFVVIPNDRGDTYAAIKKKLCIENAIPSQVITVSKVLSKPSGKYRSFSTKVLVQMATKLKATPWIVKIPLSHVMVVGFDTYHEKEGDSRGASVGALVASYNGYLSHYYSKVTMQPEGTELCDELYSMLAECLQHYRQKNGCLPSRVFFYRDGVGEGQVQQVLESELAAIRRLLESESNAIKLTFIIVSKRINTRLFEFKGRQPSNPPSGTVVDDVVTCPERYDFFLISQNVRQGTVNPTSYNVIYDKSGLKPDNIQAFTFKMCHLYYNMSSTVRVPAACLYAHKLADLVGKNLRGPAHPRLNEYLYYL